MRLLLNILFAAVILTSFASAQDQKLDSLAYLFLRFNGIEVTEQPLEPLSISDRKCGMQMVNEISFNIDKFDEDTQSLLKPLLDRPVNDTSFVSPNGFFRVHYNISGPNAPMYDLNLLALALDSVFNFEINELGYNLPPNDNGNGGDNLYDIYIQNISGLYGYTQFEAQVSQGSERYTSYMVIHNDYDNSFASQGINGARVTVAHEFHHAIQGGNYIFRPDDSFFYEITSTAMEEFVFDYVNDYYAYMQDYFNNPGRRFANNNGYNLALWNIYLQNQFGHDLLKRQWELMPTMRALNAIGVSIFEYGSDFTSELNNFGIWTYFTGYRNKPSEYFEEGANYPLVNYSTSLELTSGLKHLEMNPQLTSNNFILFSVPSENDTLVSIITNGDYRKAIDSISAVANFEYTLFNDTTSGSRVLGTKYSALLETDNDNYFSGSEILNYIVVFKGGQNQPGLPSQTDFAYPNPFYFGENYLLGKVISFPVDGIPGETVSFHIFTSAMELVYQDEKAVSILPGGERGISWQVKDQNNKNLASGIYIFVIEYRGNITKGKLAIFDE